ncbi:NADPH-dependent FMN reductase [Paeniglutamicibacter kerguelensis]|uniref:NAD(P)H-dependent FMN reductase n=1 Tax=Paeniglutamicibacter kerguelensis TaxID=254788 RepID=A0ABS4XHH0_9MICC|nr:NAD(P)H-dependent oxidoreductase [Paeniglutamicibacter kerguelensis]MBP2387698.1 NAD(P)H-dependent FMN reductase [Paeniglutamicibacter kerguelensis]
MSTSTERPLIKVIVGSVRPVRVGDQIAAALAPVLAEASGARVEIIDLAGLALPMLDEPMMPAMGNNQKPHTIVWSEMVKESDAVVFLTPQYNGGYPAALKNAVDYLYREWSAKPALIVSYGGHGHGGGQSGAQLRSVLEFVGLDLVAGNVELTLPRDSYGADWRLTDAEPIVTSHETPIRAAAEALGARLRNKAEAPVAAGA